MIYFELIFWMIRLNDIIHAGHKRHEKRLDCCNLVNILSIEPHFCRDIEVNSYSHKLVLFCFWNCYILAGK